MTAALTRLADVAPETVTWLWPSRIPVGKLVTLDGDPGVGKSTLSLSIAATVTTGGDWPDGTRCEYPGAAIIMSAEDGLGDTIRPRLDAAGADCAHVHHLDGTRVTDDDGHPDVAPAVLGNVTLIREAITETAARLLIVDVMMAYLPDGIDSHKDQHVRRVLTPLARVADETGCTVMLLRHPPKGQQTKAVHAGGGSIGIIGAARVGLLAMADPDDDDTRVLTVSKNNLAPMPPSWGYRVESVTVGGVDTSMVTWLGEHHASATELVTRAPDDTGNVAAVLALVNGRTKTTAHDVTDSHEYITYENARQILSRLAAKNRIVRDKPGVYMPCHSVTVSHSPDITLSDTDFQRDNSCDTDNAVSQSQYDCDTTRAVSHPLSHHEIAPHQGHPDDRDNCDTVTAVPARNCRYYSRCGGNVTNLTTHGRLCEDCWHETRCIETDCENTSSAGSQTGYCGYHLGLGESLRATRRERSSDTMDTRGNMPKLIESNDK